MTNKEKYKTEGERAKAFYAFCERRSCRKCPLWNGAKCLGKMVWEARSVEIPDSEEEWREIANNRPLRVLASAIKDSNVEVVNDPGRKYAIDKLCEYATNLEKSVENIWHDTNEAKREMSGVVSRIYTILKHKFDLVGFSATRSRSASFR